MDEKQKDDVHLKHAVERYRFLNKKDVDIGVETFDKLVEILTDSDFPVSVFEKALANKKAELDALCNETIPGILQVDFGGVKGITYDDLDIKIEEKINVKVVNEQCMISMFEDYGRGDLVKTTVDFPKGIDTSFIVENAKEKGYEVKMKTGVHHATRDVAIRDIINQYPDQKLEDLFPAGAVEVTVFSRAKIK